MTRLELSDEEHDVRLTEIEHSIADLDAATALLQSDLEQLDHRADNFLLNMRDPLVLGPPSFPIEDSSDADVPEPLVARAGTRFLDQLPDVSPKDLLPSDISCHICMEPFDSTEELPVKLPCGHVMGRNCLDRWLAANDSCPLCRRVLFEAELRWPAELLMETGWEMLLEGTVRFMEPEVLDLLDSAGVSVEDARSFVVELGEIMRQQAAIERRLDAFEARNTPSTPLRGAELGELVEGNEAFEARLGRFRARHRALLELPGVGFLLPRGGPFFGGP